ncbi:MAG: bifunctional UDP-N-acetylglucosamine diphosphorylase/glucosamine-1-phosphate N-acetyltransferase GlmU [Vicinamibacteria bacterium]
MTASGPSSRAQAVVLAAGKGTRMKSARPKVLHALLGRTLLDRVLDALGTLAADPVFVVVGHGAEAVEQALAGRASAVRQEPPLGTGDAVRRVGAQLLAHSDRTALVLNGDLPLLRGATLERLLEAHRRSGNAATLLTALLDDAGAYGRVVREAERVLRVVEAKDASAEERRLREINVGVYAFEVEPLLAALARLTPANAQGEFYLTDAVGHLVAAGHAVGGLVADSADEGLGVNTLAELAELQQRLRRARLQELLAAGVLVEDPASTWVSSEAVVEADAWLRPFSFVEGRSVVRAGASIGPFARIVDAEIGPGAQVLDHSLLQSCVVGAGASVGPFARVRPETEIGARAHVGNFVELKKTRLGEGSKASHLSYLGDAEIGGGVNIGAGTITCNYDGVLKHPTRIGDGAFIGSDATLVAPVSVGPGAYVAAGSTITEDVPRDALALGRSRQVVKPGWAAARRAARPKKS